MSSFNLYDSSGRYVGRASDSQCGDSAFMSGVEEGMKGTTQSIDRAAQKWDPVLGVIIVALLLAALLFIVVVTLVTCPGMMLVGAFDPTNLSMVQRWGLVIVTDILLWVGLLVACAFYEPKNPTGGATAFYLITCVVVFLAYLISYFVFGATFPRLHFHYFWGL